MVSLRRDIGQTIYETTKQILTYVSVFRKERKKRSLYNKIHYTRKLSKRIVPYLEYFDIYTQLPLLNYI